MNETVLRRAWTAAILLLAALIIVASLTSDPLQPTGGLSDKYTHGLAYFSLALLSSGIATPAALWRVMLRCFLLGAALEGAQALFTAHRSAEIGDLAANAAGIVAAWLLAGQGRAGWGLRAAARIAGRRPT